MLMPHFPLALGAMNYVQILRDASFLELGVLGLLAPETPLAQWLVIFPLIGGALMALLRVKKPDRALDTNVEFFTALLLEALGFPRDAFTGVFAAGRVGGCHGRHELGKPGGMGRPGRRGWCGASPSPPAARWCCPGAARWCR